MEDRIAAITYEIGSWTAFLARISEICILSIFIALIFTVTLLWKELKSKVEALEEEEIYRDISIDLDQFWCQYDQVCLLVDHINRCFDFVLLIFVSHSVVFLIQQFPHVFCVFYDNFMKENMMYNPMFYVHYVCTFIHEALRFFAVVAISHRLQVKVGV